MRAHSFVPTACCLLIAACGVPTSSIDSDVTLELQRLSNGNLQICDAADGCEELPYDGDCSVIQIDVDTASGATCERCVLDNGTVRDLGCVDTTVACAMITIPEPDCVVCAYVGGSVIYSDCNPNEPQCRSDADCAGPAGNTGRCVAGECVFREDCTQDSECPDGLVCEFNVCPGAPCTPDFCPPCVGQCVVPQPPDPCSLIDCAAGEHCEVVGLCDGTPDPVNGTGDCREEAVCVPNERDCNTDMDCGSNESCVLWACPSCTPNTPPENCQCIGTCQPIDPNPCATVDCAPGYECVVAESWPPQAQCIPISSCESSDECAAGEICEQRLCPLAPCTPDYCPPCPGACVPEPQPCQTNAECDDGDVCITYCWDCAIGDNSCQSGCKGECYPGGDSEPPPAPGPDPEPTCPDETCP